MYMPIRPSRTKAASAGRWRRDIFQLNMKLPKLLSSAVERVNPIVVKELRQAVQNRLVVVVLALFLMIDLLVVGIVLLRYQDSQATQRLGADVFTALYIILTLTCLGFVPLYAAVRFSSERNSPDSDLLFTTTLSPGAIVRGKFLSATAITLLIFSACMPFLTLTYLLRGIDLPTIFIFLAIAICLCVGVNMLGVFVGAFQGPIFSRGLLGLGLLFSLFVSFSMVNSYIVRMSIMGGGLGWSNVEFWREMGVLMFFVLLAVGLFYVYAAALVSPKLSNRMMPPRIYVFCAWAASGLLMIGLTLIEHNADILSGWMRVNLILFSALLVFSLGERDVWTMRVRRKIPRNPLLRLMAFLIYSGSAGGMIWYSLLAAATLSIASGIANALAGYAMYGRDPYAEVRFYAFGLFYGYILCYCLLTVLLRIVVLRRWPTATLPIVAVVIGIFFGILGPFLIDNLITSDLENIIWWQYFSPIGVFEHSRSVTILGIIPSMLVAIIALSVLSLPWLIMQWRRFTPYRAKTAAPPDVEAIIEASVVEPSPAE
jgi:hypothetical protein